VENGGRGWIRTSGPCLPK